MDTGFNVNNVGGNGSADGGFLDEGAGSSERSSRDADGFMSVATRISSPKRRNSSGVENQLLGWPTLRHLGKKNEQSLDESALASRYFWPIQQDDDLYMASGSSSLHVRSSAFMGHSRESDADIDLYRLPEQGNSGMGTSSSFLSDDSMMSPVGSLRKAMDNCSLDTYGISGFIDTRARADSPGCYTDSVNNDISSNTSNSGDSDSVSSGIYEMPGDTLDELQMELYGCNISGNPSQQQESSKTPSAEANLQLELAFKDHELSELNDIVEALNAEMLVQRSELEAADHKMSQLETSLQCSICLETFSQPHSLGCGHTFCMECLKQWLAQSMQCPTCRSPVQQRPSIAFVIQDVLQCLGHEDRCLSSSARATSGSGNQDPWRQLFPLPTSGNSGGSYERCRVCTRWTLRGGACPHCDLERIRRRLASSINVEGSTPRQSPAIHMSRLTRRPTQVISRVERLLESVRSEASEYSTSRSERHNTALASSNQTQPGLLVIRRSELETSPLQSPRDSFYASSHSARERLTSQQRSLRRANIPDPLERSRLSQRQTREQEATTSSYLDGPTSPGRERNLHNLTFFRSRYEEPPLSPVSARTIGLGPINSDTRRRSFRERERAPASRSSHVDLSFTSETIGYANQQTSDYPSARNDRGHRLFDGGSTHSSSHVLNPRTRSPSDYYVLRLDDNDSTTEEDCPPYGWLVD
ncbi:E3 ubiquitin ligase [Coemansia sp. RSA 1285]|nr:E3 ubiquitin ligase [Coemansia sp. RSA 1285]